MAFLPELPAQAPAYAELMCQSAFSFGVGASQPEELVARAHALGYSALALTDECSVAGVVRAHTQAQALGLQLLPGALFQVPLRGPGPGVAHPARFTLVALPVDAPTWAALCGFVTQARSASPKGQYRVRWPDPAWAQLRHCQVLLVLPADMDSGAVSALLTRARAYFDADFWVAASHHALAGDEAHIQRLQGLAAAHGVRGVAVGAVRMHLRSRKPLQDVLTAVRLHRPLAACGLALQANAQAHLRQRRALGALYPPAWLAATLEVARRCTFSLEQLRYHYPLEAVLPGQTPAQTLHQHTWAGAQQRYPQGVPAAVAQQLGHELGLIAELKFEMYFLTVHDLVAFARGQGILCQGRGSAANSAVCYCLGITEVDPARSSLLFERFISRERREPPDIDVDFEHQRREEVIQYIYTKYGRDRAALTAVATSYRPRSALRDVGRVLQISECLIAALAHEHPGMYSRQIQQQRLQEALARLGPGFVPPPARQLALWLELASGLLGLPRHLSQHPGGFVLTQGPLTALVPVEPAAMAGRSVIQWDKDDLDALGLMKVDVLALGMLSALAQSLRLIGQQLGRPFALQDIPADDPATFEMVSAADTVGVFQIESRAQMSMLPRLKPRCFYDLVVQVAIVRPGPIQGGMVHPYLQARAHPEQVRYASPALQNALQRTLGVPIFQEQVMQIAMLAAGFTPGESDQLRRAMAAWKRKGGVSAFYERLVGGMLARGYSQEFAQRIFAQIEGFGEYGFPESHAASFALLVWASAWVKRHHPACFLVALLNSQPMGFYSPSQLVQDAQRHGVPVLPVDVCHSHWECTLEPTQAGGPPAVRLGLNRVHGLSQASAQRLVATRDAAPWRNMADLAQRAGLSGAELQCLAHADALTSLGGHRRLQLWQASAHLPVPALWQSAPPEAEPACHLPPAPLPEEVRHDYAYLGLTLRPHPLSFLREKLLKLKHLSAQQMRTLAHGRLVRSSGLVVMRQSPATAHGVTFVTLEDETGTTNVIVWRGVKARFRSTLLHARLLAVHGTWQRDEGSGGQVCHLVAGYLQDLTPLLGELAGSSRDFR